MLILFKGYAVTIDGSWGQVLASMSGGVNGELKTDEDGMQVRVEIYEKLRETQRKLLHKIANRAQGRD